MGESTNPKSIRSADSHILRFERQLRRDPRRRGSFGLRSQFVDQPLQHQPLIGRRGAQLQVGASHEAQRPREFAAAFVASRLADQIVGGKRRHAKTLPQRLPDSA